MSDFNGLVAISFFGLGGFFLGLYIANVAAGVDGQIRTGVTCGTPISVTARRALLFMMWFPYQMMGAISMLFVALVETRFADLVDGAEIKLLAHLFAFVGVGASLMFLSNAVFGVLKYRRYLRRLGERNR
jgi:hypothetical protein